MEIAIAYGCKTAKDFAIFIHKYNPSIKRTSTGKIILQGSFFSQANL